MSFTYACDRRHDLTRRAIPTLESIKLYEDRLHCVQGTVSLSQPFDGDHVTALDLSNERQATQYTLSVDVHRTCATLSLVASFLSSREGRMFTQGIE
ncbi:hypothetical protein AN403_5953 [Pseudomonas fluorescens]|uniref:Uncharacterized protein n=1 Tax=Pseudomonas fluorescens TaxID=294 RepID=A0A0P8XX41_PSEFL|nr:hypothetical protein AN403_5953 [Pseudomonas fluorescens]